MVMRLQVRLLWSEACSEPEHQLPVWLLVRGLSSSSTQASLQGCLGPDIQEGSSRAVI